MEEKVIIKSEKYNIWGRVFPIFAILILIPAFIFVYAFEGQFHLIWLLDPRLPYGYLFLGLLLIPFFCCLGMNACELTITERRAYGKIIFGRRVDLPLDSISAVGVGLFKSIHITTASGAIKFSAVKNNEEMHEKLSTLLIERQNKPAATTTIKQEAPRSNADELKKYKELLDSGIITQEEFNAKKKQLLGL